MLTRRHLFKLLTGVAALAVAPALASVGRPIAVADVAGTLLPLDGSMMALADYPELAQHLLHREAEWLARLDALLAQPVMTRVDGSQYRSADRPIQDYDGNERFNWAPDAGATLEARQQYVPILSPGGEYIRLPRMATSEERMEGTGNERIFVVYKNYIQALPGSTIPIGSQCAAVDSVRTENLLQV